MVGSFLDENFKNKQIETLLETITIGTLSILINVCYYSEIQSAI